MDVLVMILTSVCCGALATFIAKREGIGGWMGDQIAALFGGGIGFYMVNTQNAHKALDYYLFWVVAFTAASAIGVLMFSNALLGAEEEEKTEPTMAELQNLTFEDQRHWTNDPIDEPLRRAA